MSCSALEMRSNISSCCRFLGNRQLTHNSLPDPPLDPLSELQEPKLLLRERALNAEDDEWLIEPVVKRKGTRESTAEKQPSPELDPGWSLCKRSLYALL